MSIIAAATSAQLTSGYNVDGWMELELEPMTKVWAGYPGDSEFFFSEEDARVARGAYEGSTPFRFAETLWRLAQARPSQRHGYRLGIEEFVVDMPVIAAVGACVANTGYGSGTAYQYFIPDWQTHLYRTGRRHKFKAKSY